MSQQDDGEKLVAIYSVLSVLCSFEKTKKNNSYYPSSVSLKINCCFLLFLSISHSLRTPFSSHKWNSNTGEEERWE